MYTVPLGIGGTECGPTVIVTFFEQHHRPWEVTSAAGRESLRQAPRALSFARPNRHRMDTTGTPGSAKRPPHRDLTPAGTRTSSPGVPEKGPLAPGRRLFSLDEAAGLLGLSVHSLRRLVWDGTLPAVRLTRRVQVDLRDLERLIERVKGR